MTKPITYFGTVQHGAVKITHRKAFDTEVRRFEGRDIEITVAPKSKAKSIRLNRYYFGAVVRQVMYALIEAGYRKANIAFAHAWLKSELLRTQEINEETGEVFEYVRDYHDLKLSEQMDYVADCVQLAAEVLHIVIQDPDPEWKLKLKPNERVAA